MDRRMRTGRFLTFLGFGLFCLAGLFGLPVIMLTTGKTLLDVQVVGILYSALAITLFVGIVGLFVVRKSNKPT